MEHMLSILSPGVERLPKKFLESLAAAGGKPMEQLSPTEARAVLSDIQGRVNLAMPKADISEKTIFVNGEDLHLTIVRPPGEKKRIPAFMFFHGGGWMLGDFPTHERLVRDLVVDSGAAAIFVHYTRSPEAQYGVAINQAYAATKWVAERGKEINVDGSRLAVVGNSAGGNIATVVCLMAKERGGPAIRYQVLLWPVTDANFDTVSYNQFSNGYYLTKNMMKWFWDNYCPDKEKRKEIYASPLRATAQQLNGMPPALIQIAEFDPLRDEGEAYGRKLDAAGVDVSVARYDGMFHDFGLLNVLRPAPATRSALIQATEELRLHLGLGRRASMDYESVPEDTFSL
jgi:acetyl esterase/lipase